MSIKISEYLLKGELKMCDGFSEAFAAAAVASEAAAASAAAAGTATAAAAAATATASAAAASAAAAATTMGAVGGFIGTGVAAVGGLGTIGAVVSVASAGMSIYGQSQQSAAAQKAAMANYNNNMSLKNMEQAQINQQSSQDQNLNAQKAMADEARMITSAGESGVSGVSTDRSFAEIAGNSETDIAVMEANRSSKIAQTQAQAAGQQAQAQGIINTNLAPSAASAGLQIAGAAGTGRSWGSK
jgi:hypothetical protein